jgi:hypothetical protein
MNDSALARTRRSLHAVAEQVLAAALHRATGRIGLRSAPGGFATPVFDGPHGVTRIRVEGVDLVVEHGAESTRAPLTTVGAAAAQVGVEPGAPADVYPPATELDPDRPLDLEPAAAARLAELFATVDRALQVLVERHAPDGDGPQLWPEHFDLAVTIDEVNYGGSPGDDEHPLPYLYVGPWDVPNDGDPFWNEPFGASLAAGDYVTLDQALAFFEDGRRRVADQG